MNLLSRESVSNCSDVCVENKLCHTDTVELPVDDPAVNNLEDDNPLSTFFEEVRHLLLQLGLHLMLGDHLQVVPRGFAAPLHLTQILLQLVEVHLMEEMLVQMRDLWRVH